MTTLIQKANPDVLPMQAFHLDMKLSQYRRDYLEQLFPRLRDAGYNVIVFEIENKVRLDCLGTAAWCEAYDKSEFSEILESCRSAGLTAIPLIQTYAHLEWLLTHAPFHTLREQKSIAYTLCPLKTESRDFLLRYISEVGELFGNPDYIHLGGDEATYMGTCPECQAVVGTVGKGGLFARHMGWIARHAIDHGSRPMFWADMVLAHPECLTEFPREVIWVDWHYEMVPEGPAETYLWGEKGKQTPLTVSPSFRKTYGNHAFSDSGEHFRPWFYAEYLLDQGFDVVIASAASCAGDHTFLPSLNRAANIASACLKITEEPRLFGHLVTSWTMRLPPLETQWPLIRLPSVIRSQPDGLGWQDALAKACQETFGVPIPDFPTHWDTLGRSFPFAESSAAFDWESGYVGQPPPIPVVFAKRRLEQSFDVHREISATKTLITQYQHHADLLAPRLAAVADSNIPGRFWLLAVEAITLRAREYLVCLRAEADDCDADQAIEILRATENLADRWKELLLEIGMPSGVERTHAILFAESQRSLAHISWHRYQRLVVT